MLLVVGFIQGSVDGSLLITLARGGGGSPDGQEFWEFNSFGCMVGSDAVEQDFILKEELFIVRHALNFVSSASKTNKIPISRGLQTK